MLNLSVILVHDYQCQQITKERWNRKIGGLGGPRRGKRVKEGESWNTTFMQFSFCFICTAWSICRASLNSFSLRQSEVSSSTLWLQVKSKKVFPGKPYPPCHKKQDNTKRRYRLSYNMPISFNHSILLRKLPCRKIINISNRELIWPSI